ncbi:MAG: 50S ribosomal protein L31e [Acidilobaceae archaeon]
MPEEGRWVYIIPLRRVYWGRRSNRADRAVRLLRAFVKRHTKADEVVILNDVNNLLWERGREKPPARVKVLVDVKEEKGEEGSRKIALVRLASEKFKPGRLEARGGA